MNSVPPLYKSKSYYSTLRKKRAKSNKHDTLLKWKTAPKNCLIIKKIHDTQCTYDLLDVTLYLLFKKKVNVFLRQSTFNELKQLSSSSAKSDINIKIKEKATKIVCFDNDCSKKRISIQKDDIIGNNIHLIIVLGGDGTLLFLVSLFRDHQHIPPIICFQRGSLGFLAPFQMNNYQEILSKILTKTESVSIAIRMRLTARIWRHPDNMENTLKSPKSTDVKTAAIHHKYHRSWSKEVIQNTADIVDINNMNNMNNINNTSSPSLSVESSIDDDDINDDDDDNEEQDTYEIAENTDISFTKTQIIFPDHRCNDIICHALNEVLVHRDNNASMMTAKLFIDGDECTVIQADGMIFSTPTGSTAYNISAGGSLISPTVPCIALTPICPHTLSFRPVVVSDETIIHIQIPKKARFNAIISFDGRNHINLYKGDVVEIIKCPYPVPTFKSRRFNVEWFQGLVSKFNWNLRELQKPFQDNYEQKESNHNDHDDDDNDDQKQNHNINQNEKKQIKQNHNHDK